MIQGRAFLDVAWELLAGLGEADWRSAAIRAYYAGFHVARQLFDICGFKAPDGDRAHAYLWLRLSNSGHPDVNNAGLSLNHLRGKRNLADYDLYYSLDQISATTLVQAADEIIKLLEMVMATPLVCAQITDNIKIYERDVLGELTWHP
jgi:hypothetical protein